MCLYISMSLYMYVCMYNVYLYVHVHVHVEVYVNVDVDVDVGVYVDVEVEVDVEVCVAYYDCCCVILVSFMLKTKYIRCCLSGCLIVCVCLQLVPMYCVFAKFQLKQHDAMRLLQLLSMMRHVKCIWDSCAIFMQNATQVYDSFVVDVDDVVDVAHGDNDGCRWLRVLAFV